MARMRKLCALVLMIGISAVPVWGTTPTAFGTVTTAQGAHIGSAAASAGTTVYGGDKLSTEAVGAIQVRTNAARFQLSAASSASLNDAGGIPAATLLGGTAVFSTANAKAFLLRAGLAEVRPQTDAPTVAQVTMVNEKELLVRSSKGALAISVDGETQVIPEGSGYRVVIDPDDAERAAAAQGPRGAGTNGPGGPPLKAGRSRFVLIAVILTGVATGLALHAALESPDRP